MVEMDDERDWYGLPKTALKKLLLWAGCAGRHGHAAVCKSWAEAAAAATEELEVELHKCADIESLQLSLDQYGHRLQSLKANLRPSAGTVYVLRWPCLPDLQQLCLQNTDLQLTGPDSFYSVLAAATKLTSLSLVGCRFSHRIPDPPENGPMRAPAATAVWDSLLAALAELSEMTELSLRNVFEDTAPGVYHLDVSQIGCMTKLQRLQLGGSPRTPLHVEVSALTGLTNLTHFGLQHVTFYMQDPPTSSQVAAEAPTDPATRERLAEAAAEAAALANVTALLSWLPQLQYLTHLQLRSVTHFGGYGRHGARGEWFPPPTAYRAITGGSNLQYIDLRGTAMDQMPWQRAFPAVMQHTTITALSFGRNWSLDETFASEFAVRSCPNTHSITIEDGTISRAEWDVLQHRTCLTSLSLGGSSDDTGMSKLALLTQLRQLRLPCRVYDTGLDVQRLTGLTQLSWLGIASLFYQSEKCWELLDGRIRSLLDDVSSTAVDDVSSTAVDDVDVDGDPMPAWIIANKAPAGSPPDVCSQLQALRDKVAVVVAELDSSAKDEGRDWSGLPKPALTKLMLLAGCTGRHGRRSQALVCKAWAEAAAAASAEGIDLHKCAEVDSLQLWLDKYGRDLKGLKANLQPPAGTIYGLLWPDLSQLQQLHLKHAYLQLTGPSSICSVLAAATKLTSLGLTSCRFSLFTPDTPALAGTATSSTAEPVATPTAVVWDRLLAALPALTDLTELTLCDVLIGPALWGDKNSHEHQFDVSQIGGMTKLQRLQLGGSRSTVLHIEISALTGLTSLRHFGLQHVTFCRDSCPARAQDGHGNVQLAAQAAADAAAAAAETAALANVAALLEWLPQLKHLTRLQLRSVKHFGWCERHDGVPFPPPTAYKALTANSNLQHIDLRGTAMQQSAWQRAFPAIRQHTSVTELRFGGKRSVPGWVYYAEFAMRSCPNTSSITYGNDCRRLEGEPFAGTEWEVLQQRTCLTSLSFDCAPSCVEIPKLAGLTQLRQLKLHCMVDDTGLSIHPLTALTQLSCLGIASLDYRWERYKPLMDRIRGLLDDVSSASIDAMDAGWDAMPPWVIANKAPAGGPLDVCSQLQTVAEKLPCWWLD